MPVTSYSQNVGLELHLLIWDSVSLSLSSQCVCTRGLKLSLAAVPSISLIPPDTLIHRKVNFLLFVVDSKCVSIDVIQKYQIFLKYIKECSKCWIRYGNLFNMKIYEIKVFKFVSSLLGFKYVIWILTSFCMYKGISALPLDKGTILLVFDVASSESTKNNTILFNNVKRLNLITI